MLLTCIKQYLALKTKFQSFESDRFTGFTVVKRTNLASLRENLILMHASIKGTDHPSSGNQVAVERLPVLHYSVDFIFLSFGIMGFVVEL